MNTDSANKKRVVKKLEKAMNKSHQKQMVAEDKFESDTTLATNITVSKKVKPS